MVADMDMPAPPIIFLDIDGVLLTERAWATPANVAARRLDDGTVVGLRRCAAAVEFDPIAIALVVALAQTAGARIVVSSNWRGSVGCAETVAKLIQQGIPAGLFHDDPCCPHILMGSRGKSAEILAWLAAHRTAPLPEAPGPDATEEKEDAHHEALRAAEFRPGFRYVTLDDRADGSALEPALPGGVAVDPRAGMDLVAYRVALQALGGLDDDRGIHELPADVAERVLHAWGGDETAAANWLHRPGEDGEPAPAEFIKPDDWYESRLLPAQRRAWDLERFWQRLAEATAPREDD
ncbi:HAD domain-containing protein [Roseomonas gilardii]|uniref:HAD domain-containing protein n=1 Tax=Roseomonas gilardii TaxID=257708 RepID=UPI0004894837|nr:HAD domain-containing protein [Roseomonas gilardii]SUE63185.1 Uncharacterised protein [Roseomonas gilardii subsp. rosea]